MAEEQFDFQADLAIDKNRLDEELMRQATKMMRYNAAHAQAQYDRDRAKLNLETVVAGLDSTIRGEMAANELKAVEEEARWSAQEAIAKVNKNNDALAEAQKEKAAAVTRKAQAKGTEGAIKAKINSHPNYIEAMTRLQDAEYRVNLLAGGVFAMNGRKSMLENLTKLILSDWYSEPRVRGGEEMKAGAALGATEAAIMSQPPGGGFYKAPEQSEVQTQESNPPPMQPAAPTPPIGLQTVGTEPGQPPLLNESPVPKPAPAPMRPPTPRPTSKA